jgi:hypothetical protein
MSFDHDRADIVRIEFNQFGAIVEQLSHPREWTFVRVGGLQEQSFADFDHAAFWKEHIIRVASFLKRMVPPFECGQNVVAHINVVDEWRIHDIPVAIVVWKRVEREIEAESPGFDAEHT